MRYTKVLDFLTQTDGAPVVYILKASIAAVIGTILMILVSAQFMPAPPASESEPSRIALAMILLGIWPLISTAVIAAFLRVAKRFTPTYWHAAAAAAISFALLLSLLLGVVVGIVYLWPFFIYAVAFLAWQIKSEQQAWLMSILVHSTVNLLPVLLM